MNELKTRGVGDVLIAVVDGLKGFPEAIGAVFPLTTVQTCIIHLIRNSAETAAAAAAQLDAFEAEWGRQYPAIGQAWRRAWEHVVPLFAFPPAIRIPAGGRRPGADRPSQRRARILMPRRLGDDRHSHRL